MKLALSSLLLYILCTSIPVAPVYAKTTPQIQIVSPTDGQTIIGEEITLSYVLGNVSFGSEAHIHMWIDAKEYTASTAAELHTHHDHILSGMPPGIHTITLEAVRPDHTSFDPPVVTSSRFTIQSPLSPTLLAPTRTVTPAYPFFSSTHLYVALTAFGVFVLGVILYLTLSS